MRPARILVMLLTCSTVIRAFVRAATNSAPSGLGWRPGEDAVRSGTGQHLRRQNRSWSALILPRPGQTCGARSFGSGAGETSQHFVELLGTDEHLARLGSLARPDDAARLHQVHESAGLGEAPPQLALQHRGRAELAGDHELHRLGEDLKVVADLLVIAGPRRHSACASDDVFAVARLRLVDTVLDDLVDLGVGNERALH